MRRAFSRPDIPSNMTRAVAAANRFDRNDADPLGIRRVFTQVANDLYGTKDVQDAITASYVWMADQIGHITLGLVPTMLACWLITAFGLPRIAEVALFIIAACLIFSYWLYKEITDYRDTKARAAGVFPFDSADIVWNVKTALFYFGVGGVLAVAAFIAWWAILVALGVLLYPALRVAFWWLRRKLAFQQAGGPYLYRLANFPGKLTDAQVTRISQIANLKERKVRFWDVMLGRDPVPDDRPDIKHLLVTGPLGAGKTSLAVGMGTEFAFALGIGRYLTAAKLVQMMTGAPEPTDKLEHSDGRWLWPWRAADLLIVDDVDAGATPPPDKPDGGPRHLVEPADLAAVLRIDGSETPLEWLSERRSVWIIGDESRALDWRAAIAGLMGIPETEFMLVNLTGLAPAKPVEEPQPTGTARRIAGYVAGVAGLLLLLASAGWWYGESQWGRYTELTPQQAFADGSFGLEVAPLKYILVADTLSAKSLRLPGGGSWVQRFGFLPRGGGAPACAPNAPANLPVGFSVSNRLPGSATPVPVQFVGLTCALCHSTTINGQTIIGAGSQTADVIGFTDAFVGAVMDPAISAGTILNAYDKQCPADAAGFPRRQIEAFLIDSWLSAVRGQFRDNATKYDQPFHGAQIEMAANIQTGPSRTRPFRSVVRNTLDFPAADNRAYSKVPLAAMQADKPWSQFDGSIGNATVRSMIAVFTSGASIPALNERQIADNVQKAAEYTLRLGESPKLPTLDAVFPDRPKPDAAALQRGHDVYMAECDSCHGHPLPTGWVMPPRKQEPPITDIADIGTDPYRLQFRYNDMLPVALATTLPFADVARQSALLDSAFNAATGAGDMPRADWWQQAKQTLQDRMREFPVGHRLAFPDNEIALRHGYLNAPIPFAWLRAPFLHNASVPTLRHLIGLEPRPTRFCRGSIGYDPVGIGVVTAAPGGPQQDQCPPEAWFLFDTAQPGNSNAGHDYPRASVGTSDREALLSYLGTL